MAATEIGVGYLSIVPSFKGAKKALGEEMDQAEKHVAKKGFGTALFGGLKTTAVGAGVAVGGVLSASLYKGFKRLSAIEDAKAKLGGLGHDAKAVTSIMDNALASVKGTAFGMDEAASTAGTLVASGIKPGKDLEKTLKLVGDSATIAGRGMGDMGLIWSSVAAKGKLQGDDAMQLLASGVPIWQMVGKVMGKTAAEAQALGSKGQVSFEIFQKAMEQGVGGAALKSGNTTAGAFKNMNAALGRFGASLLKGAFPLLVPMFNLATTAIDKMTAAVGPLEEKAGTYLARAFGKAVEGIKTFTSALQSLLAGGTTVDFVEKLGLSADHGLGFVLREAIGSVYAFIGAWRAFDGDVTSSGVPGFMERAAFSIRTFWEQQLKPFGAWVLAHWRPIVTALGASLGLGAWSMFAGAVRTAAAALSSAGFAGTLAQVGASLKAMFPLLAKFAPLLRVALGPVGLFVGALGYLVATNSDVRDSFAELGSALMESVGSLFRSLGPVIAQVVQALAPVAATIGSALAGALSALAPAVAWIVRGFADLVKWLSPALPAIVGITGAVMLGVKAFAFLSPVISAVTTAVQFLWPILTGVIATVGWIPIAIAAGVAALAWFFTSTETGRAIVAAAWDGIKAAIGAVVDWIVGNVWPVIQAVWDGIAAGALWLWQNAILPAWQGIQGAIGAVITWVSTSLVPALQGAWTAVATGAMWLWQSVILPAWGGIRVAIAVVAAVVMTYIQAWVWIFQNVLAPVVMWLWQSIIAPAWAGIQAAISAVVTWVTGTLVPALQTAWNAISAAALWLWNAVFVPAWRGIQAAVQAVATWISGTLVPALQTAWNAISAAAMWLWNSVFVPVWNGIRSAVAAVVTWFQTVVVPAFTTAVDNVKFAFDAFKLGLSIIWSFIRNTIIQPVLSWFQTTVVGAFRTATNAVRGAFDTLKNGVMAAWSFIKSSAINPVVSWFQGTVKPLIDRVTGGIKSAFDTMKDAVGRAWDGLKEKAKAPIRFVVETVVNNGLIANFNKVAEKLGIGKLPSVALPKGFARGGILPGWSREAQGDDQLVPMRRGEGVLVSEGLRDGASRAAFLAANAAARRGVSFAQFMGGGFAGGGIFGDAWDWTKRTTKGAAKAVGGATRAVTGAVKSAASGVAGLAGDAWDWLKDKAKFVADAIANPSAIFKKIVDGVIGHLPLAGLISDAAKVVPGKLISGIVSKITGAATGGPAGAGAPVGPAPTGTSGSLASAQALAASMGLKMTSGYRPGARTLSGYQSLHSMNRARDFAGSPRQMMAFFNAMWARKPTELLYSPAGARQWNRSGRMGWPTSPATIATHYNHVHVGYAKGGLIKPYLHDQGGWHKPGQLSINQTRKPEAVLTHRQWQDVSQLVGTASATGTTVNVHVGQSDDGGHIGRRVAETLQLHELAGAIGGAY